MRGVLCCLAVVIFSVVLSRWLVDSFDELGCGVYNSDCESFVVSGYSYTTQAYVLCDTDGFATKVEWTKLIYSKEDCEGTVSGELRSIYNTVKTEGAQDKSGNHVPQSFVDDATYKATYASAIMKSNDTDSFTSNVSCTPSLKNGDKYELKDVTCTSNGTDIFNMEKDSLGKEIDITIKYSTGSALFTGLSDKLFNKQTEVAYQPYEWYMIRNGYLGPEYSSKIVSAVLALIMVVYDGLTRKRWDYLITFCVGTILWIILEFVLLQTGVREYQAGYLGGKELGFWSATIIRCMQECGFLMVYGMFNGDRLCDCMKGKKNRPTTCHSMIELAVVFVLLTVSSVSNMLSGKKEFRAVGSPDVAGRRNMTQPASVALFCGMTVICIVFILICKSKKFFLRRTIGQTIFYTWVTGLGMLIEYFCNARWVEVGHYPDFVAMPSGGHEFLAFMYDLIIEVIVPPVFIYFLMVTLRILPDFKRDGYYNEEKGSKKTLPITEKPQVVVDQPLPAVEL